MPQRNTVQIVINADDNASDILKNVAGGLQDIGTKALQLTGAALAAGGAAIAGFTVASLNSFSNFEQGMNMIFTNLPGITEDAMSQMSSSVQAFMERTGRSAEEATAAMYDALSAGIPQDNIFAFMETANKVAIGGVTDLGSAVDGLTSVVNAYGADVISVDKAADIMFETARLGKTTIGELSAYLFQVIPAAAAVGVSFEDIGASLAVITAQGVPTSVAANQVQKAILELSQAGSTASDTFSAIAGKTFPEFIAEGNTMADAMALMEQAAMDAGIPINQMFGSIEAGQAALSLTGANMDNFASATEAMGNSAGATERAFNTMNQGIGVAMSKLGARWESLMISFGRLIEPFVTPLVDAFSTIIAIIAATLDSGDGLNDWIMDLPSWIRPLGFWVGALAEDFFELVGYFANFIAAVQNGVPVLDALQFFFYQVGGTGAAQAFEDIVYWVGEFGRIAGEILGPIADWIGQHIKLQDVFIGLGIAIATVAVPAIAGFIAAFAPLALVIAGVALLRTAWEENWGGIQEKTQAVVDWVTNTGWPALMGFFTQIADAWNNIVWPGLQAFWNWFMIEGLPAIMDFIDTEITPRWELFVSIMGAIWDTVSGAFSSFYNWFMAEGLAAIMDWIDAEIIPRWEGFVMGLSQFWDMVSTAFGDFYNWFMVSGLASIMDFIDNEITPRWELFVSIMAGIWDAVKVGFEAFVNGVAGGLQTIADAAQGVIDSLGSMSTSVNQAMAQSSNTPFDPLGFVGSMFGGAALNAAGGQMGQIGGNQFGGKAYAGVPTWVGEGGRELFVPSSDGNIVNHRDSELMNQGGGGKIEIVMNIYGAVSDDQARESAYKLKRELSAQGFNV